ncbi:MAG: HlyD family secretion protein [Psychroserpens sp.]|jgi:HlyD family secretion protein
MQIPSDRKVSNSTKLISGMTLFSLFLIGFGVWSHFKNPAAETDKVHLTVQKRTFENKISAWGILQPESEQSIVSQVSGTIKEVKHRAGDIVNKDDIIILLDNPSLVRKYEYSKLNYESAKALSEMEFIQFEVKRKELEGNINIFYIEWLTKTAEVEAHRELAKQGITSQLLLRKEEMLLENAKLIHLQAVEKLELNNKFENLSKKNIRLKEYLAENEMLLAKQNVDSLIIRAQASGVLQGVNDEIKLGEYISEGAFVGVIASSDKLYAKLKIGASFVNSIFIGQEVKLNIKGNSIVGNIKRIEPNIQDNQAQIEVYFTTDLPTNARSSLDVTGEVIVERILEALVLELPNRLNETELIGNVKVKKLDSKGYIDKKIEFGSYAPPLIHIISGVDIGDQVIF